LHPSGKLNIVRLPRVLPESYVHVLVIEDEIATVEHLVLGLSAAGHTANWAYTGEDGYLLAKERIFDVLIIDRMLPDIDGLSLVLAFRRAAIDIPILVLTTMGGVDDRVAGLNAGADDYLVKPFSLDELTARVNALGRRRKATENSRLEVGDLVLDKFQRKVKRGNLSILLQQREYQILLVLMENAGNIVTRKMLIEQVWKYDFDPPTNIVESHLSRLRTKVDKGFPVQLIHTIRRSGYCLHD
jgi:two-component system, OmpR family, response regulator